MPGQLRVVWPFVSRKQDNSSRIFEAITVQPQLMACNVKPRPTLRLSAPGRSRMRTTVFVNLCVYALKIEHPFL